MKCKKDYQKYKKRWQSMEIATKSFCFVSMANYLCLLILGTWLFVDRLIAYNYNLSTIITGVIGLLLVAFMVYLTFEGLFHDNIYELYTVFLAQIFITMSIAGALVLTWGDWGAQEYTSIAYNAIFFVVYAGYIYPLYTEYSWTFFQKAGADPTFRQLYRRFLRFLALLKIETMTLVVTTLIISNLYNTEFVWVLTFDVAVVCGAIILYVLGLMAFQEEIRTLTFAFWTFNLFIPCFIGWCFFYIPHSLTFLDSSDKEGFLILIGTACATLFLVWILVTVSSIMLYPHFGEGLNNLDKLRKKSKTHKPADNKPKANSGGGGGFTTPGSAGKKEEAKGFLNPSGEANNNVSDEEEDSDDGGGSNNKNVFDEIFQNTAARGGAGFGAAIPVESPLVSSKHTNYDEYKKRHGL